MTDIVEHLRRLADGTATDAEHRSHGRALREAADLIETLRAAIRDFFIIFDRFEAAKPTGNLPTIVEASKGMPEAMQRLRDLS